LQIRCVLRAPNQFVSLRERFLRGKREWKQSKKGERAGKIEGRAQGHEKL
jgi:hypothetical protein